MNSGLSAIQAQESNRRPLEPASQDTFYQNLGGHQGSELVDARRSAMSPHAPGRHDLQHVTQPCATGGGAQPFAFTATRTSLRPVDIA
jgi:hypothetical protein